MAAHDPAVSLPRIGGPGERRFWLTSPARRREALAGYLAILPWFLGFIFFSAGPIVASFVLMFTKWEVITPPAFIGQDD